MAFRVLPTTIKDPQADAKAINDNFEQVYLDIIDTGGEYAGPATANTLGQHPSGLDPGDTAHFNVFVTNALIEKRSLYVPGRVPSILRLETYLDNDNDLDYRWPDGDALTDLGFGGGTIHHTIIVQPNITLLTSSSEERITSFYIFIRNEDPVAAHTYYLHLDAFLWPTPNDSRFL